MRLTAGISEETRAVEARASLEQDLVRYAACVLAGIRPSALFSCPLTRKNPREIRVACPQVLLEREFVEVLAQCKEQVAAHGVIIDVLAQRKTSALLYVHRPEMAAQAIGQPQAACNLAALGYDPSNFSSSLRELRERLHAFDTLDRARDFWDFPHEIGYFLGYPAPDVMAYTRNRGGRHSAVGTWHVYGCKRRVAAAAAQFHAHAECVRAYWQLYLEGASLAQLAALGALTF